jgi:hypothetical protein
MKIIEKEFNALTGEETTIERNATASEKAERDSYEAEVVQSQINRSIAEAAKIAAEEKLAALGLTTEDLKALGL